MASSTPTPRSSAAIVDTPGHGLRVLALLDDRDDRDDAAPRLAPMLAAAVAAEADDAPGEPTQADFNRAFKQAGLPPKVDVARAEAAVRELLAAIGEDTAREGIRDTPRRVAKLWREFIEYDAGKTETSFAQSQADQMVVVTGMRVWSMCEHHLAPFWADITVGYIQHGRVLGLSKFARIAHLYAHRLQLQEQLVWQIAEHIQAATGSADVAVLARGQHLCMVSRGIKTDGLMVSNELRGAFRDSPPARQEFMALATSGPGTAASGR